MSRILIIDDDPSNREILKTRLEIMGHDVIEAVNGEAGLAECKAALPDLIFLDVMMPKMDGWQICKALKANPQTQEIPIVMLTALSQKIEELRGYESGVNEYLTKPWDPEIIQKVLTKWLSPASKRIAHEQ